VNAVNLLPTKHRPRQATGGKQGSSFVLLGVLAAVVIALLVYVLSVNSINDSKTKIADAQSEAARASAQADALGAYGNFAKVKQERVARVKQLAQGRVDWERLLREIAHVLPNGVWVTKADASDTPDDASAAGGNGSAPATSRASATAAPTPAPHINLQGCAPNQPAVAATIVRLRHLQGASDVELDHSTRPESKGSSSAGGSSSTDCGTSHGSVNYEFQVKVTLESPKPAPYVSGKVPASLGGGQ
jgi:Tfp pilus assembly protein PilN